jgi:hypothetical protein
MLLLQRSIGSPRRRRPWLPLGLRVSFLDCLGLVSVFLVGSRSSSVARAAGPSVACGSHLLGERRARSHSVVVGCGRGPAAAAGAAAARRSRGRPFLWSLLVGASLWPHTKAVLSLGPGFAAPESLARSSAQTTLESFEFHAAGAWSVQVYARRRRCSHSSHGPSM